MEKMQSLRKEMNKKLAKAAKNKKGFLDYQYAKEHQELDNEYFEDILDGDQDLVDVQSEDETEKSEEKNDFFDENSIVFH